MGQVGEVLESEIHFFEGSGLRSREVSQDTWERGWAAWFADGGSQMGRTWWSVVTSERIRRLGHVPAPPIHQLRPEFKLR